MSLNVPQPSGPSRNISAIYHMEEENFLAKALAVPNTAKFKDRSNIDEEHYKFFRKGVQKASKRASNVGNAPCFDTGAIYLRSVLPETGTEANYSEADFKPHHDNAKQQQREQLKSRADLQSISELTQKYFDCERVVVDVDGSLAQEKVGRVSHLLQNRVHESFMKEFWALQYHYPKDHFKKVGDGIKKPAPCSDDFEPTLEEVVGRRKRTKVLAVPKYIVKKKEVSSYVKLPAVESKSTTTLKKSQRRSIYSLIPQPEGNIVDIKTMEDLASSVDLTNKPFVGSAGKRALISHIGLEKAESLYTDKPLIRNENTPPPVGEVSPKPKRKERTHKDITADLHRQFQNLAKTSRSDSTTSSAFQKELFLELPKCLRGNLDKVVAILKRPMYERRKTDITFLKLHLLPLNAFGKMKSEVLFEQLCLAFTVVEYPKGHTIFKQGDYGDAWYITLFGRVDIRVANGVDTRNSTLVRILPSGEGFGEMALINSIPRGATVVTRTPTILLKVEKDAFKKISGFIHEFEQRKLFKFLRRYVPWFESLTNDQIYAISEHALWREFAPNATIIDEKQRVNQIFIIKAGTCEVYRILELEVGNQIRKKRVLVGTLSVGHHFNHQLLKDHDNPNGSAFTVVARDEVECATLVAVGDWINYNLSLKPYEYGLLSRNELIKLDTTYLRERKFRKLQTKILESMAKEYAQDPNAKLETISFNENKSLGWKR